MPACACAAPQVLKQRQSVFSSRVNLVRCGCLRVASSIITPRPGLPRSQRKHRHLRCCLQKVYVPTKCAQWRVGGAKNLVLKAKESTEEGDVPECQPPVLETGICSETRRVALSQVLGHVTASFAGMARPRGAEAFPSPSLETLQESKATASTRCGNEIGINALRNPAIYRGAATDKAVRTVYNLDGLLPARRQGLQEEVDRARLWIQRCGSRLEKYQALMTLKETSRDCFFALLLQNVEDLLPVVYTPTVGEACREWSHLLHRPTGLYISMKDKVTCFIKASAKAMGNVRRLVDNWPEEEVKLVVITDGERILGLGDLGANGLGIPVGKSIVHTVGGIPPRFLIPIVVDAGCNTKEIREDPLYIGTPQERIRGQQYDDLMEEVWESLQNRYGSSLLVHWEDLSSKNSYRILAKARQKGVSTFNDDIESTAAAVVASVFGATQIPGVPSLQQQKFLLLGAGQANIGSARLLLKALQDSGLSSAEAQDRLWLYDSKGLVCAGRSNLTDEKASFARTKEEGAALKGIELEDALAQIKPTGLIGATAKRGTFSKGVIQSLTKVVKDCHGKGARPLVLALSNPDNVAECTAEQANDWSGGSAVYASGTTFPAFKTGDGKVYEPSQANNSLIFPGVGLGCIASGAQAVTEDMMLAAAKAVTRKLTPQETARTSILPATSRLREVALAVAASVALAAAENMVASSTGKDILSCLPLSKGAEDPAALREAEACIAKLQYDPFD